MNFINLICNKCDNCNEKDIYLNMNKKDSRNSLINQNINLPKDEIISNDSTNNNLEIIDYPYSINIKEDYISNYASKKKLHPSKNNHFIGDNNKVKKIPEENINNFNNIFNNLQKSSIASSSIIMNNDDSFIQNKALLSNYYSNCQKLKNKNIKKNNIPVKKNKNPKNNISFRHRKNGYKEGLKVEMCKPDNIDPLLLKKKIKSSSQIIKSKKKMKVNTINILDDDYEMKKCNTDFIILKNNVIDNNKKNVNLKNKKNNMKEKYLKNKTCITYRVYNNNKDIKHNSKTPINKLMIKGKDINNIKKNFYKKNKSLNKIEKKYAFMPKNKLNNSSSSNYSNSFLLSSKNIQNNRTTTKNNYKIKRNYLNFSHLWLNNKNIRNLSKSYVNPLDKTESKKKRKIKNIF